jgi:hypothetical protein
MTDHRTLRQRIEEHFGPPCDGKSEGICDQCQLRADILEALREAPADAPPATPFSKTWRDKEQRFVPDEPPAPAAQVLTAEHDAILGGEEYRDLLRQERDVARETLATLRALTPRLIEACQRIDDEIAQEQIGKVLALLADQQEG